MKNHFQKPVVPFSVSTPCTTAQLVQKMGGTSFQARNLARAVDIWAEMLKGEVTIYFGLTGAMIPAGMRQVIVFLIENRLIDCLVSTGANLYHDLHETLGNPHWQGRHGVNDNELAAARVNRIYDVLLPEDDVEAEEEFIMDFAETLDLKRPYTTREFFNAIGHELIKKGKGEGILTSAAKASMPVYCPAIADSVYGTALAGAQVKRGKRLLFDVIKDVVELTRLDTLSKTTGVIFVGGGTPKNFIQQAVLCGYLFDRELPGHDYAIQITTDAPQWGGLSGCTFEEARSWRKVSEKAMTSTVYCEATIALPLIVSAVAEGYPEVIKNRKRPTFQIGEELVVS
ncbi:MAG: deoxyhypusine synthase family protein [Chloroflexi bacterium]|nr:deoxyhypusine synthase family protein [Chloroflexota bacterium]